jgi:hypothetical protein
MTRITVCSERAWEVTMNKTALASVLLCIAVVGCKKKGGGDIKSVCESNFAHGEMNDGKWSPGKGDKAKFMDYCVKQNADIVRCSSMEIELGDKSCEKHTGVGTDGFTVKIELAELRDSRGATTNAAPTTAAAPAPAPAPEPAPAPAPVPAPVPAGCTGEEVVLPGPKITVCTPAGYVKPLDKSNAKDKSGGSYHVAYSADGTSGGAFVATFNLTYNAKSSSPPDYKYLEEDATKYCDTPTTLEDIADGKGKSFVCTSKELGHNFAKSKIYTDKNVIDCSAQWDDKPEVATVCKTLKQ